MSIKYKSMTLDKNKRSAVFIVSGIDPAKTKSYAGSAGIISHRLRRGCSFIFEDLPEKDLKNKKDRKRPPKVVAQSILRILDSVSRFACTE